MKYRSHEEWGSTSSLRKTNQNRYTYRSISILLGVFILCCLTSHINRGGGDNDGGGERDLFKSSIGAGTINNEGGGGPLTYGKLVCGLFLNI